MEDGKHQELCLELFYIEGLHLVKHALDSFEAQILQNRAEFLKLSFDCLLGLFTGLSLRHTYCLVQHCRQNVTEYTELEEKAKLDAGLS